MTIKWLLRHTKSLYGVTIILTETPPINMLSLLNSVCLFVGNPTWARGRIPSALDWMRLTHHYSWSLTPSCISWSSRRHPADFCHHTPLTCTGWNTTSIKIITTIIFNKPSFPPGVTRTPVWGRLHSTPAPECRPEVGRDHWGGRQLPPGSCTGTWLPASQSWRGEKERKGGDQREKCSHDCLNLYFFGKIKQFNRSPKFVMFFQGAVKLCLLLCGTVWPL